ncbi:MAG: winged helix-turn-helix transcriptional regulator [Halolamina sp.]
MDRQPDTATDTGESPPEPTCYCPLDGVVALLSRKYAIQVVCVVGAFDGARYGEIEAAFGDVSSSTLSSRLTELADAGLLDREQYDTIPPKVEYSLTADGEALCERLKPVLDWAEQWDRQP